MQATLYFINNIEHDAILERARVALKKNAVLFLLFFLGMLGMLLTMSGVSYHDTLYTHEAYKFLDNLLSSPAIMITGVTGVALLLYALFITLFKASRKGIWFSGVGTVLVVVSLFSLLGFNQTAIYPSLADIQSSLSIENSSGSHYTLRVMAYVSLMVPFVLGYIYLVWRSMDREKITSDEVEADHHHY